MNVELPRMFRECECQALCKTWNGMDYIGKGLVVLDWNGMELKHVVRS